MKHKVVIGILKDDTLGYSKGATVITANGTDAPGKTRYIYGLIKDIDDEFYGNFVASEGVQIENIKSFNEFKEAETLSQLSLLTMKGLLKIPSDYF